MKSLGHLLLFGTHTSLIACVTYRFVVATGCLEYTFEDYLYKAFKNNSKIEL